jgi:hypothetical protein
MNRKEAWDLVSDHVELGYEGGELEECREYILKFNEAHRIVSKSLNRKWWEVWK